MLQGWLRREAKENDIRNLEENPLPLEEVSVNTNENLPTGLHCAEKPSNNIKNVTSVTNKVPTDFINAHSMFEYEMYNSRKYKRLNSIWKKAIEGTISQVGLETYLQYVLNLYGAIDELKQRDFKGAIKITEEINILASLGWKSLKDYYIELLLTVRVSRFTQLAEGTIPAELLFEKPTIYSIQCLQKFFYHNEFIEIYKFTRSEYFRLLLKKFHFASDPINFKNRDSFDEKIYQKYSLFLSLLIQAEHTNLKMILNDNERSTILNALSSIIEPSLNEFSAIVDHSNTLIKAMATESILAFKLMESLRVIIYTVEKYFEAPASLYLVYSSLCSTLRMVFTAFAPYIESRINSLNFLPLDGTPCNVTMEIISTMEEFSDYLECTKASISTMVLESWISTPKPAWYSTFSSTISCLDSPQNGDEIVSSYFSDMFDALLISLELKSISLKNTISQTGFCLLVNITHVEYIIKHSNMRIILTETGIRRLVKLRGHAYDLFLASWKNTGARLLEPSVPLFGEEAKYMSKYKLKIFYLEFEKLVQNHKEYNFTNSNLKECLSQEIFHILSGLYHEFFEKRVADGFIKRNSKCFKYDTDQFDTILKSL
ncbi:hypothetical protein NADFUDRAFT_42251 [Nadsonia fulvescens var. elongata DSM 6958]|uniref:Exocyst complex subunit Exo70 C-terminal domain-containing protein n=1 Tax=Nadsonia fulvescens var. elongata DSM 6958 TaxID=857566 RepID=A0A1E3PHW1_9ASCO|nr:hypothetical protein NADFUDRAFT_42251 [Nadsonia fulvescens var. elongata DSM 6958]